MLTTIQSNTRTLARPHRDIFAEPAATCPSLLVATAAADETNRLAGELAAHGYRTAGLEGAETSPTMIGRAHWDAAVLDMETAESLPRHVFDEGTFRVLVVSTGHPDEAIRALTHFGAAAVIERPVHLGVLAAILSKLSRKAGEQRSAPQSADTRMATGKEAGGWRLAPTTWSLEGPDGSTVGLTRTETAFLSRLAGAPGEAVPRNDLIKAMGYRIDYYEQRRLDTFVSRLRKKVAASCGTPLPLRSIHAFGYAFTAFVQVGDF